MVTATKIEVFNCAWSPSNTMYLSLLVYRSFTNGVSAKRARARVHSLWPNYMNWKHDQSAKAKMENYFVCYFAWTVKSHNSNTHSHTHTNERSNVRALSNVFFFFFFCDCLFHSGDFELRNGMEWNEGTAEKKLKPKKSMSKRMRREHFTLLRYVCTSLVAAAVAYIDFKNTSAVAVVVDFDFIIKIFLQFIFVVFFFFL